MIVVESQKILRARFEQLYRKESNVDTKEGKNVTCVKCSICQTYSCTAQVARDLHNRSRTWASDWLKRYREERRYRRRIKKQIKSGRPPQIYQKR